MTTTPGLPKLPGVEDDKEAILKVIPSQFKLELLDHPNADRVLKSVQHCSIAHFACHGLADYVDPSKSGLVFQRQDHSGCLFQDAVTVLDVSELKLERARIAYLSACSTAENKAVKLKDEVIHIVSGFQVAGFAHAVGCLWPPTDTVCVKVAGGFYGSLFRREDTEVEDIDIATALHESIGAVRATDWDQPLKWAQFVHYGA
jgi:CHAT domain-containing protein